MRDSAVADGVLRVFRLRAEGPDGAGVAQAPQAGVIHVLRGGAPQVVGLVLRRDVILSCLADEFGYARLPASVLLQGVRIAVSALGFQARVVPVAELTKDERAVVEIDLVRSAELHGRVLTEAGTPVVGATVTIAPPGMGRRLGSETAEVPEVTLGGVQKAVSDSWGEFTIPGLPPGELLMIGVHRDGHSTVSLEQGAERAGVPLVRVTDDIVVVRMRELLFGRFRAVDAATREPLADRIMQFNPVDIDISAVLLAGDGRDSVQPALGARLGLGRDPGVVNWIAPGLVSRQVSLHVQFVGYEPALVTSTGWPLGEFLGLQLEEVAFFRATHPVETGSVVLRLLEHPHPDAVSPLLEVELEEYDPGGPALPPMNMGGTPVQPRRAVPYRSVRGEWRNFAWNFRGVPAGSRRGRLRTTWGDTELFPLVLAAGGTTSVEVRLPAFTGAAVILSNSRGEQLFGIPYRFQPAGGGGGTAVRMVGPGRAFEISAGGDLAPPEPYKLWPGRWTVSATAPGIGKGMADFEVKNGEVTIVSVSLQ